MKKEKPLSHVGPSHVSIANFRRMDRIWKKIRAAGLEEDVNFRVKYFQKDAIHCVRLQKQGRDQVAALHTKTLALN